MMKEKLKLQSWAIVKKEIDVKVAQVNGKVIEWRRDFHQHPELGNQEIRTASLVAGHLKDLGLELKTEIAKTGVVGILKGDLPGPVVALRADMDALPITEECDLPFASKVKAIFNGNEVGVMHACGHDVHTSTLMGVAEVLTALKSQLLGTVKFIFQPAEESVPDEPTWGAAMMIDEGVLENPKPDVIFGLHVWPLKFSSIGYTTGAFMASVDDFKIEVKGKGAHGAMPWEGIDPIVVGSQIVMALQTLVSRNVAVNEGGAVVTIGSFNGGNRSNVIPEKVEMLGTIRTFNAKAQQTIHKKIESLVNHIATAHGTVASISITKKYPTTINNKELTLKMLPVLQEASDVVEEIFPVMAAEDFSFYQQKIPGLFFFLGILAPDTKAEEIEVNHSPRFMVDENAIPTGVKALSYLAVKYLIDHQD